MPGLASNNFAAGILVVAPSGRIQFIGRIVNCRLRRYFPPRPHSRRLPEPLARWTESGDPNPHCWESDGRRLVISLVDLSRKGARCYLVRESADVTATLTARELAVLYWIGFGKTNREIGELLGLKTATIKKHVLSICEKLGVENRTAAAYYAREFSVGQTKAAEQ